MLSKTVLLLAGLAALVSGSPCRPPSSTKTGPVPTPTLPSTGASDLPLPPSTAVLKRIAVGHGLQNYTCASTTASAVANGALAVLYDVTSLYPGTKDTGLSQAAWNALPTTVLWSQSLPLNLQNANAASPGTPSAPNRLPEASYGAVIGNPFPSPAADLVLGGLAPIPYLGHHYFDASSVPSFDLRGGSGADALFARVAKKDNVKAPASSDAGILNTGAVDWLRLVDDGTGASHGVSTVYRVVTAGGNAQACSDSGEGSGSVPYAAFYWFFE